MGHSEAALPADTMDDAPVDAAIVAQAADWLVTLQSGATEQERAACLAWRRQHPAHELAWRRMGSLTQSLNDRPSCITPQLAMQVVDTVRRRKGRRQLIKGLLGLGGAGVLVLGGRQYLHRETWLADYRTATGARRQWVLEDGTVLLLNTASAVDVVYGVDSRSLFLRGGEIMVTTGRDAAGRPLLVHTPHGRIQPVGTRFTVRLHPSPAARTHVSVLEGAVRVRSGESADEAMVTAHQSLSFDGSGALPRPAQDAGLSAAAWADGMLIARDMPLLDFVSELARYRSGWLRCDPALAHLRVTGTFPLADTDGALQLLSRILPLEVQRFGRYWVTLKARA